MRRWALRIAAALTLAYLALLAGLWWAQASLIYPAPQDRHAPAPGFAAVTLTSEDGLALEAHWRAPDPGRPAVVYFHGNGGSLAGATRETALLAERGYGVLLVEYRGYGGNPGAPSEAGLYADGRAAMAFLAAQGIAPARTVVIGHSLGSGTATEMARQFAPAALILLAPFTTLPDAAAFAMPWVPAELLVRDRYDNRGKLAGLAMPVLVLHGTADAVVPFTLGKRLAAAGPTATFRAVEGAGHMISLDPQVQAAQADWLAGNSL
ncbi:alpha/beta hydrolase [Erythrobacter donghaensis]|jgi:pimeloyl-ACP methyl ester carboxylesterase|uniref:alpha/beta hydrolase n=1 Tax=Erythrobacter donghaensis TaxID=267135 RepID=UPI00093E75D3|nr:alpha/beta fold hydrolase [Erythrobacter donghaensis]